MATVYEAVNSRLNKRVAMKFIDAGLALNEDAKERFQREALAAGAVDSPNIVQIFDADVTEDGSAYIVMELLHGQDLGAYIETCGCLEVDETLRIGAQIVKAIHHAHKAGIVHRDLKPDNIFLSEREDEPMVVKLLDFGVSKFTHREKAPVKALTRVGAIVGTPHYMSPEQAQGRDVDGRTDIYSVGAILFECLTGQPPHTGNNYEQIIVDICTREVDDVREHNADVPAPVAEVIKKALSQERDARYGSARELLTALFANAPQTLEHIELLPESVAQAEISPRSSQSNRPKTKSRAKSGSRAKTGSRTKSGSRAKTGSRTKSGSRTKTASTRLSISKFRASLSADPWAWAVAGGVVVMLGLVLSIVFLRPSATKTDQLRNATTGPQMKFQPRRVTPPPWRRPQPNSEAREEQPPAPTLPAASTSAAPIPSSSASAIPAEPKSTPAGKARTRARPVPKNTQSGGLKLRTE